MPRRALLLACCLTLLTGAGCGKEEREPAGPSATPGSPAPSAYAPTAPEPVDLRNPVGLMKRITGCKPEGEPVDGETDLAGNRYSQCQIGQSHVDVRTLPGSPEEYPTGVQPDDSTIVINGDDFVVTIYAYDPEHETRAAQNGLAERVAREVGGRVVTR